MTGGQVQSSVQTTVRVVIEGRVQGVWYRGWTVDNARTRGLSGWVRNRRDGSVEAVFSGPEDKVADMMQAWENGPPAARVDAVTRHAARPGAPETGFTQRPTE